MKNMRRALTIILLLFLCTFSTGCIRMGAQFMMGAMSALGPTAPPNIMVTDTLFDGTRHVAPLVISPLAPLVIIDLPFEVLWDVLIIPTQLSMRASRKESQRRLIASMSPPLLAENGYFDEFRKRVQGIDQEQKSNVMVELARPFAQDPDKFRPYIDYLFSLDHECGGDIVLDSLFFKDETALTSYLFKLGLRPSDFPHEHAVFNAVKYIHLHIYGRPPEYSTERQLERIRILLENGCNPNSIPEFNCKYVWNIDDFQGESSLDMAREALAAFNKTGNEDEAKCMREIVSLLEKHGAKTAKQLNLSRSFKLMKLKNFYEARDLEHFRMRMDVATRKEKEDAMLSIMHSGAKVKEFEPFCRLLLADGIPFPLDRSIKDGYPPNPQSIDTIEFAFNNGRNLSDYIESPVIYKLCREFCSFKDYDAEYIELLKRLLKIGFDPNVIIDPGTRWEKTTLTIMQRELEKIEHGNVFMTGGIVFVVPQEKNVNYDGRKRMIAEAIEILKQYGGMTLEEKKKLIHNKGLAE